MPGWEWRCWFRNGHSLDVSRYGARAFDAAERRVDIYLRTGNDSVGAKFRNVLPGRAVSPVIEVKLATGRDEATGAVKYRKTRESFGRVSESSTIAGALASVCRVHPASRCHFDACSTVDLVRVSKRRCKAGLSGGYGSEMTQFDKIEVATVPHTFPLSLLMASSQEQTLWKPVIGLDVSQLTSFAVEDGKRSGLAEVVCRDLFSGADSMTQVRTLVSSIAGYPDFVNGLFCDFPAVAQRTPLSTQAFALVVVRHPDSKQFLAVNESQGRGWWLPAGHVDAGESFATTAVRECKEEAGLTPRLTGVLAVQHQLTSESTALMRVIFYGEPSDPNASTPKSHADAESEGAQWMGLDELDERASRPASEGGLRGRELLEWGRYVDRGAPIAPLSFFNDAFQSPPEP